MVSEKIELFTMSGMAPMTALDLLTSVKDTRLVSEVLVEAGLVKSKAEARRVIRQGGIKINDCRVQSEFARLVF